MVSARQSSCNSILVSWSSGGTVSGIRRNEGVSSNTFTSIPAGTSSWENQNVPCKHSYTYTVLFQRGGSDGPSNGVKISVCCKTGHSTYLVAIGQKTSESVFGSFAFLDPFGDRVLQYLHEPGEIVEGRWRLGHELNLFPNEAVQNTSLSLIQSSRETLEAIVRVTSLQDRGNDLLLGYEFKSETGWQGPFHLGADDGRLDRVTGSQALIQSDRDNQEQFELLVPREAEIDHYTKRIEGGIAAGEPWKFVAKLPPLQDGLQVTAVSVIQSSPSELVAIALGSPANGGSGVLLGYVFDQGIGWRGTFELKSDQGLIDNVTGAHAFVRSDENTFELVAPRGFSPGESMPVHYRLDNQKFQEGIWSFVATLDPPGGDKRIQAVSLALTLNTLGHLELVARERPPQGKGEDFMVGYVFNQEAGVWQGPLDLLDENGQRIIAKDSSTPHD